MEYHIPNLFERYRSISQPAQLIRNGKAIALELADHSKRSVDLSTLSFQNLLGAKTSADAAQVHLEYVSAQAKELADLTARFCNILTTFADGTSHFAAEEKAG